MTTNSLGQHMQVYHVGMQHAYTGRTTDAVQNARAQEQPIEIHGVRGVAVWPPIIDLSFVVRVQTQASSVQM
jgi:hypothetical protein